MSGREPEESVRLPIVRQSWRHVLFLHWRYPPDVIAALLPNGLEPDLFDGAAWVTATPFQVERATVPPAPPVPGLSSFPETNLRTYVRGPGGRDGLWFFTLEVASLPNVLGGRLAVPYRLAHMDVDASGDTVTYRSERCSDRAVGHRIEARHLGPLTDRTPLDDWLTGRWRAWVRRGPLLATVPVEHEPWSLLQVDLVRCEETLLAAHGLPEPSRAPIVHASPGVDARLGMPTPRRIT